MIAGGVVVSVPGRAAVRRSRPRGAARSSALGLPPRWVWCVARPRCSLGRAFLVWFGPFGAGLCRFGPLCRRVPARPAGQRGAGRHEHPSRASRAAPWPARARGALVGGAVRGAAPLARRARPRRPAPLLACARRAPAANSFPCRHRSCRADRSSGVDPRGCPSASILAGLCGCAACGGAGLLPR